MTFASAGGASVRSDEEDEGRAWAVVYDDGMSLTTASEQIARTLAEAERQRGARVTVRRLADVEARRLTRPEPVSDPEPAPAPGPADEPGPALAPEPAP